MAWRLIPQMPQLSDPVVTTVPLLQYKCLQFLIAFTKQSWGLHNDHDPVVAPMVVRIGRRQLCA